MMVPTILKTLNNSKAKDIQILQVEEKTPLVDTLIICTATSSRHGKSVAGALIKLAKSQKEPPLGVEGLELGEWVLVNLNNTVVHIMLSDKRDLYQLDQFWGVS